MGIQYKVNMESKCRIVIVTGRMFMSTPNSYIESLTSNAMVLEQSPHGRDPRELSLAPSLVPEDTMRS